MAGTRDLTVSVAGTDSCTLVYKLSKLSDPSIWEKTRITALGFDVLSGGFTGGSVDGGDVFNKIYTPGGFPSLDGLGGDRNVCINGKHGGGACQGGGNARAEEHTSELQSIMSTSHADYCLKKKTI